MNTVTDYTSVEVTELTGVSYRQLDYWLRHGVIPERYVTDTHPGSGGRRHWHPDVIEPLRILGRISNALDGPSSLTTSQLAALFAVAHQGHIDLAPGITLTWTVE